MTQRAPLAPQGKSDDRYLHPIPLAPDDVVQRLRDKTALLIAEPSVRSVMTGRGMVRHADWAVCPDFPLIWAWMISGYADGPPKEPLSAKVWDWCHEVIVTPHLVCWSDCRRDDGRASSRYPSRYVLLFDSVADAVAAMLHSPKAFGSIEELDLPAPLDEPFPQRRFDATQ